MQEEGDYKKYYDIGYEYGFDRTPSLVICYTDEQEQGYNDGVRSGKIDREVVNRSGSSNT
jgi:hypothetical protein